MGFTGKEADEEVGLVYFGERYLVPRLGRWASPDPLHVHAVGGGEALNSYHYVAGNYLQAVDLFGLNPTSPTDATQTVLATSAEPDHLQNLAVIAPRVESRYIGGVRNISTTLRSAPQASQSSWRTTRTHR